MTQNPLGGGGDGGFDMNALLEQAQAMQEQLVAAQAELSQAAVTGSVAGGQVSVRVSGTGELVGVEIKPGAVDTADADGLSDLGDMVVAAYNDAKAQADAMASERLGPMAGGLGL